MTPRQALFATLAAALPTAAVVAPAAGAAACGKRSAIRTPSSTARRSAPVPAGVRRLRVIAAGAGGGDGSGVVVCDPFGGYPGALGGAGTTVSSDLRVAPGRRLYVWRETAIGGGRGVAMDRSRALRQNDALKPTRNLTLGRRAVVRVLETRLPESSTSETRRDHPVGTSVLASIPLIR